MDTKLILTNINKHIELNETERIHFQSLLTEQSLPKNARLLRQGERCQHIYFVTEGILRAYYLNDEGKESTVMFAMKDWWITDMYCFLNERPAMVNIHVVQACRIFCLTKKQLDALYQEIPKFNIFFRILMQNAYCREQLRMIQRLSLQAKDRYEQFVEKYPQLAMQLPLKQIASYLGVTPEFLSYLRSNR